MTSNLLSEKISHIIKPKPSTIFHKSINICKIYSDYLEKCTAFSLKSVECYSCNELGAGCMSLTKEVYIPGLIDKKVPRYLHGAGGISIEETKSVRKTCDHIKKRQTTESKNAKLPKAKTPNYRKQLIYPLYCCKLSIDRRGRRWNTEKGL